MDREGINWIALLIYKHTMRDMYKASRIVKIVDFNDVNYHVYVIFLLCLLPYN